MVNLDEKLAEILEVDSVDGSEVLQEFEAWDSLTALSLIAMIDSDYNVSLSAEQLNSLKTVDELKKYISSNQ